MQKCKSVRLLQFQATSGREVDEVNKIKKSMPAWLLAYHKIIDCQINTNLITQINTNLITDLIGVIKKDFHIRVGMKHYETEAIKGFKDFFKDFFKIFTVFKGSDGIRLFLIFFIIFCNYRKSSFTRL